MGSNRVHSTAPTGAAAAASRKRPRAPATPAEPSAAPAPACHSPRSDGDFAGATCGPAQEQQRQHVTPEAVPNSASGTELEAPSRRRSVHDTDPNSQGAAPARHAAGEGSLFTVALNGRLYAVHSEDPFLNPRDLFLPHGSAAAASSASARDGLDEGGAVDGAETLHAYGNQPVLLLDCTGAQVLRVRRRRERAAVLERMALSHAEKLDIKRTRSRWIMRRVRAGRSQRDVRVPVSELRPVMGEAPASGPPAAPAAAPVTAPDGAEATVPLQVLLGELSRRRRALEAEVKSCELRLRALLTEKRRSSVAREGCVLLLPSPDTGNVRLHPRHHYRTVCFVGEELREVLPRPRDTQATAAAPLTTRAGYVEAPTEARTTPPPPSGDALSRVARVVENATGLQAAEERLRPAWAVEELLSYAQYMRRLYYPHGGSEAAADAAIMEDRLRSALDQRRNIPCIVFDGVDDFYAQPASTLAMCREWAIDRFRPSSE